MAGDAGRTLPQGVVVLAVAAVLALLVAAPILALGRTVWLEIPADPGAVLRSAGLRAAVVSTLMLAAVVALVAVPIGTMLALAVRRSLPARTWWQAALLLPVLIPDFVLGYSWLQAYGRAGLVDDVLGVHWQGVQGPVGVAVVLAVNAVPLVFLVTTASLMTRAEPDMERAARVSGARPLTVVRTITLPLLRPAIAAATVLVFALTLGAFAIPQVLGAPAGFATVTTRVYAALARGSDPAMFVEAVTLALLLVVLAAAVIAPAESLLGPRAGARRSAISQGRVGSARGATDHWVATGLAVYLLLTVVVPMTALLSAAVTRAAGLSPTPANWTLENFRTVLTGRTLEALGHSLLLATVAATVLTVLGALVATVERTGGGRGLATLVTFTLVLPGTALAVGLLLAYGRWLADTLILILLAYLAKLWALAHRPISGALDRLPPEELHAARVSGASSMTALRTIALRPLGPALVAAWSVCFLTALHEVTMSSLLYGPGRETLAVIVLNTQELGLVGATAALSVVLTVLVAVPASLGWLLLRGLRQRHGAPPRPGGVGGAALLAAASAGPGMPRAG